VSVNIAHKDEQVPIQRYSHPSTISCKKGVGITTHSNADRKSKRRRLVLARQLDLVQSSVDLTAVEPFLHNALKRRGDSSENRLNVLFASSLNPDRKRSLSRVRVEPRVGRVVGACERAMHCWGRRSVVFQKHARGRGGGGGG
jgi:hypothetical protein